MGGGGGCVRAYTERTLRKRKMFLKEQELGGWGSEDLGLHKEVGDLHGGRPGLAAEVERAARLKAGLRGGAGRCAGRGRVNPGGGGGGWRNRWRKRQLQSPGYRGKRGADVGERQGV